LVWLMVVPVLAAPWAVATELRRGLDEGLIDSLRRGGYVIYFRHAATDHDTLDQQPVDPARCETQRRLSAQGRRQASVIGAAFRNLGLPVGEVYSSPFCRCTETARIAFERFSTDGDLYFALDADAIETSRLADALRRYLVAPVAEGTNRILVSHTANLREAAGLWPKPEGVAYVFRPDGEDYDVVARIDPADWEHYALGDSLSRNASP
jgi:broad specificity phosphatase PhoE